jgi:hypothetical protein
VFPVASAAHVVPTSRLQSKTLSAIDQAIVFANRVATEQSCRTTIFSSSIYDKLINVCHIYQMKLLKINMTQVTQLQLNIMNNYANY